MDHKAEIASAVRKLRTEKGLTSVEVARLASVNQGTISRIETGVITPRRRTLERILDGLEAPKRVRTQVLDHLRALQSELASWDAVMRAGMRRKQEQIRRLEAATSEILTFQPAMIPGLLQTSDYVRRVFERVAFERGARNVEEAVQARIERQKILLDDAKRFGFVVTEAALRWAYCSAEVMAAQMAHMASLSRLDNVDLVVIPLMAPVPIIVENPFVLFNRQLVYVETYANELLLRDSQDVAHYVDAYETLRKCGFTGGRARSLLAKVAREYGTRAR